MNTALHFPAGVIVSIAICKHVDDCASKIFPNCIVPENIHTPHHRGFDWLEPTTPLEIPV